jgi:hypothetical protein
MAKKRKAKGAKKAKAAKATKAGKSAKKKVQARKAPPRKVTRSKRKQLENGLDEALRETFPGSDPVALTDPVRTIKE